MINGFELLDLILIDLIKQKRKYDAGKVIIILEVEALKPFKRKRMMLSVKSKISEPIRRRILSAEILKLLITEYAPIEIRQKPISILQKALSIEINSGEIER